MIQEHVQMHMEGIPTATQSLDSLYQVTSELLSRGEHEWTVNALPTKEKLQSRNDSIIPHTCF
jgi:hypothetical protein